MNEEIVVVASREIVDTVYRAAKMTGADDGVASMLGRATCFAVGQLDRSLLGVTQALETGQLPPFGFRVVTESRVAAEQGTNARVVAGGCCVGDLAYPAFVASRDNASRDNASRDNASRNNVVAHLEVEGQLLAPGDWLEPDLVELAVSAVTMMPGHLDERLVKSIQDQHEQVLREGLTVGAEAWSTLGAVADRYLVSEALIDAVDQPTV